MPVDWPDVDHATYYELYRGTSSAGYVPAWTKTLTESKYDDHTVVGTNHYFYWVKACNSLSCSNTVGHDEGWAGLPPFPPDSVEASDSYTSLIRVTWSVSEDTTSYEVWRAASQGGAYSKVNPEAVETTQWDDYTATPGTTHWYKVKACSFLGCGDLSVADSGLRVGPPDPPTGVTATDGTYLDRVYIQWSPSAGALGYQVYRNTVNNPDTATKLTDNAGGTNWTDYPPLAGEGNKYYYWVTASNSAGWSLYSTPDTGYRAVAATGTPLATPLPTNTPRPTPTEDPRVTNTPRPTPTEDPRVTNTPRPTATEDPKRTNTPRPTPTEDPKRTNTPRPTEDPGKTYTPRPTPTEDPRKTNTPRPTYTAGPTRTPRPTADWTPTTWVWLPLVIK